MTSPGAAEQPQRAEVERKNKLPNDDRFPRVASDRALRGAYPESTILRVSICALSTPSPRYRSLAEPEPQENEPIAP